MASYENLCKWPVFEIYTESFFRQDKEMLKTFNEFYLRTMQMICELDYDRINSKVLNYEEVMQKGRANASCMDCRKFFNLFLQIFTVGSKTFDSVMLLCRNVDVYGKWSIMLIIFDSPTL